VEGLDEQGLSRHDGHASPRLEYVPSGFRVSGGVRRVSAGLSDHRAHLQAAAVAEDSLGEENVVHALENGAAPTTHRRLVSRTLRVRKRKEDAGVI